MPGGLGPDLQDGRGVASRRSDSLCLERPGELHDEKGIPAGRDVAGGAELRLRRSELLAHERSSCLPAQRAQPDHPRGGFLDERVQQHGVVAWLVRANSGQDENRQPFKPSREEAEKASRRLVAPMKIVDSEEEGLSRRKVRSQPIESVQDRERGADAVDVPLDHRISRREQLTRRPCRAGEQFGALSGLDADEGLLE